jgi:phosphoglycerol transferase
MITGQFYAAINLFFLLSFPAVVITAFATLRSIKINPWFSISGALIYAFVPFHFLRIGHLFYTWYFVVPLFFYIAFRLFYLKPTDFSIIKRWKYGVGYLLGLIVIASFGVYYALFGIFVVLLGAIAGAIRNKSYLTFLLGITATSTITLGVFINISPNLLHSYHSNKNSEVAVRSIADSEIYGFKFTQLILPQPSHHIEALAKKTATYNSSTPLTNENITSSLGLVGAVGLLILFACLLVSLSGRKLDSRLALSSLIGLILLLFGTIGGFGSLFAIFISTSIRGWNRISIFISFAAIALFFIALQILVEKQKWVNSYKAGIVFVPFISVALIAMGIYDQTNWACKACNVATRNDFLTEQKFIQSIESAIPKGSAIYQLPYIPFPETPPLHRLSPYDPLSGFIQSKNLLWSSGGMKGRDGDLFFRKLAKFPINQQLDIIKKLGFSGVYVDRRGYADNANELITQLTRLLGAPSIVRADGEVAFFRIEPNRDTDLEGLSNLQIMEKVGVIVENSNTPYQATLAEGIDFKRSGYPTFLKEASGLDGVEDWGRWTNANIAPSVKLRFNNPLPRKFSVELQATAFGPNVNSPVAIIVGNTIKQISITNEPNKTYKALFDNPDSANNIEIVPPKPTSPHDLNPANADSRKIGIGLISLKIKPINSP